MLSATGLSHSLSVLCASVLSSLIAALVRVVQQINARERLAFEHAQAGPATG